MQVVFHKRAKNWASINIYWLIATNDHYSFTKRYKSIEQMCFRQPFFAVNEWIGNVTMSHAI